MVDVETLVQEIRTGPRGARIGAFFDFDGTLIEGYSAGALYAHRFRNFEIGPAEILYTLRAASGGTLSEDQFAELMSMGIAGWAGRPVEDLQELGERLFRQGIAGQLFHETWRLVKAHQRAGHTVAIASSATRFQIEPLARELGVEHILCTELESRQGLVTGKVAGRTTWGAGKIAAVRRFARGRKLSLPRSFAYANGDEDVPFLAAFGHPRAVNPQPELAVTAAERDWPVLQLRRGPGRLDPMPAIRTAALYGTLIGSGLAGAALGALSGNRRRGIDLGMSLFAQIGGVIGDVDVHVVGEGQLWAQRPAVYFINHQSSLIDALVSTTILRSGFTAVAKAEAAGIPVIGQLLTWADFAFIDRANGAQARVALQQALDRLAAGTSIVISPEGTRSLTPRVGRLKKGGFHLAMQAGVPIVPIVIRNAGELMWRNARTARTGTVEVLVHEPIPTTGWTKADLDAAVEQVQKLYEDTLEEWPGQPGPASLGAMT